MRKPVALLVLFFAGAASAKELPASELSVGGVASGDTETSVLHMLGQPSQRIDTGEGTELHYPGLVVTVGWFEARKPGNSQRVLALRGTGTHRCTPRGLCPGMPVSTVYRLYGRIKPTKRKGGYFLEYQPAGVSCWLQISAHVGVVKSVAVACQP